MIGSAPTVLATTTTVPKSLRISVIVPVLNEQDCVQDALARLAGLRGSGHEIIVVDGGSRDLSVTMATPWSDAVISARPGRASQMNAGARVAQGDVLLFLHIDTRLPADADRMILEGLCAKNRGWGRFDISLSGSHPLLRIIGQFMTWRSRLTGICTGDQALFVRREWFESVGAFPEIPLMEDIAISQRLRSKGWPLCLRERVLTSSRRWETRGVTRTLLLMWWLRLRFFFGADPARLLLLYNRQP